MIRNCEICCLAAVILSGTAAANQPTALGIPPEPAFEENLGQAPANAEFMARIAGAYLYLRDSGMEFRAAGRAPIRWDWIGASGRGSWMGAGATGDTASYYLGSDPSRWVTGARSFRRVERRGLYPGIDCTAYFKGGAAEYDLIIHPGADPGRVRLKVAGAPADLTATGALVAYEKGFHVVQQAPVSYQVIGGARHSVVSRFVRVRVDEFGLELGEYRRDLPLYVDPAIRAVLAVTGKDDDRVVAVTETTVAGVTRSADWSHPPGAGGSDVFIRYRRPAGGVATLFWGGDGDDEITSSNADKSLVLAGWTTSQNLPVVSNWIEAQPRYGGGESDGFVLAVDGAAVTFASYVGGNGRDRLYAVVSAPSEFPGYIAAGETDSTSWPDGRGGIDAFLARLSSTGVRVVKFGGPGDDSATALAILPGNVVAAGGHTNSSELPLGSTLSSGGLDAWVAWYRWGESAELLGSKLWGGSGDERVAGFAYRAGAGLYVAGTTTSADYPTTDAVQGAFGGVSDAFLTQFAPDLSRSIRSIYFGGSGAENVRALALLGTDILIGGTTDSTDLPRAGVPVQEQPGGRKDAFYAHLDPSGRPVWTTLLGGPEDDSIESICALASGAVRIGGATRSRGWLQGLNPDEKPVAENPDQPASDDAFAATLEYSYAIAADQKVGKNLQTAVALSVFSAAGADGVVTIRSGDPSRLLVALSPAAPGAEQAVLFNAESRGAHFYLQALDDQGEVEVALAGRDYPERRVRVRLLPSAVYTSQRELDSSSVTNYPISISVDLAPWEEDPSRPLAAQSVRAGLDPAVEMISSDLSAVRPAPRPPNAEPLTFLFDLLKEGQYTITPSSTVFPTAPEQDIRVRIGPRAPEPKNFFVAQNVRAYFGYGTLRAYPAKLTSEDPSKVRLATGAFDPYQASITVSRDFYLESLAGEGTVTVRVEGPDGYTDKLVIALAPLELVISPASVRIPVGERLEIRIRSLPRGTAPPGSKTPYQWWLLPLLSGFAPKSSDPAILAYDGSGLWDGVWTYRFRGLKPGMAEVAWNIPSGVTALGTTGVEVAPARLDFGRSEILLPEGMYEYLSPSSLLNAEARKAVEFKIADLAVAALDNLGQPATSITVSLGSYHAAVIRAVGKPGHTTTLSVSASTLPAVETPVRIVPQMLMPIESEVWIHSQGSIQFRLTGFDPQTSRPLDRSFNYYGPLPPIRIEASSDLCRFTPEATAFGINAALVGVTCSGTGEMTVRVQFASSPAPLELSTVRLYVGPREMSGALSYYGERLRTRVVLGDRLQASYSVPYGFQEVTLTSQDPSKVRLSSDPKGPGQERVTVPQTDRTVYFQGFSSEGTALVTADIANQGRIPITVHFYPSTMALVSGDEGEAGAREVRRPQSVDAQFWARPGLVEPFTGAVYTGQEIGIRAGMEPFIVRGMSADPNVAEPQPPSPLFLEADSMRSVTFRPISAGVTELAMTQPEGFVTAPGGGLRLRTFSPPLRLTDRVILAKDLQQQAIFDRLSQEVDVRVTSLDPEKIVVSDSPHLPGGAVLAARGSFYVQALSGEGEARLLLQAAGYEDTVVRVELRQGVIGADSTSPLTMAAGARSRVSLKYAPVDRGMLLNHSNRPIRPGVEIPVRIRSLDPSIVRVDGTGEASLTAAAPFAYFPWQSLRPGETDIVIETAGDVALLADRLHVVVSRWKFYLSERPIARLLSAEFGVGTNRSESASATAASTGATPLSIGLDRTAAGQPSLSLSVSNRSTPIYVEPVGDGVEGAVTFTAEDFEPATFKFRILEPEFAFARQTVDANLSAGTAGVAVLLGSSGGEQPLGQSKGTVRIAIRSSNPQVARPSADFLDFRPGESSRILSLQLLAKGDAVITLEAPAGFNLPSGKRDLLITVR